MRHDPFKIHEGSIRDRSVSGYNADRAAGDTILFLTHFATWLGKSVKRRQVVFFFVFLVLVYGSLAARIGYLQLRKGAQYRVLAERNRTKIIRLKAPRGILYDRYERPLVENISKFYLTINPQRLSTEMEREALRDELIGYFPAQSQKIRDYFVHIGTKTADDILIADIPYEQAVALLVRASAVPALQIESEPRRHYLVSDGLGPILGYVGKISSEERKSRSEYSLNDMIGKEGVERSYESLLRGQDGKEQIEVDALGREKGILSSVTPQKGNDLVLTIDLDMQQKLFQILSDISRSSGTPSVGIVMNPQNGELYAIVSVPSYDPNLFSGTLPPEIFNAVLEDPKRPLFMRATAGLYPAGSVFKLGVAAAAIDERLIDEQFTVTSVGGIYLGDRFFPDWRSGGHGVTNVYKAIADSVNTFFYIIGGGYGNTPGLGSELLAKYARILGYGQSTGIDVPGEQSGFVPTRQWKEEQGETWYQGDTYNLAIGQGSLLVTPLQVARATAVFANKGTLITPHVLKNAPAKTAPAALTERATAAVRAGMRRTITEGTARSLQSVSLPAAGKTGTAQFNRNKQPHSWFTSFAPFETPEVVVTVLVEEGGDRGYAVTAVRQFLEWYASSNRSLDAR